MSIIVSKGQGLSNRYLETIHAVQGDITAQNVDAIATLLPQTLEYRGALNRKIAAAAGQDMDRFVKDNIFDPRPGDVYAVPGFALPCKHILFAIVPVWRTEFDRQDRSLLIACRKLMEEARALGVKNLAFPPLGSGEHGFPKKRAIRLMVQGISERLDAVDDEYGFEEIRLVCRTVQTLKLFQDRLGGR